MNTIFNKNNNIIYNIQNCKCCLGTIARCKTIKELYPENNIFISSFSKIENCKKEYFPYEVSITKKEIEKCIINNKINMIIHDLNPNQILYNLGLKYNIKQYFMLIHNKININNYTEIKDIIIPYDEKMKDVINIKNITNVKNINMEYNINYTEMICKKLNIDKLNYIKEKYNIDKLKVNNKPILIATYGTGSDKLTEKFFQYVYNNYKDNYNLIFIYGLMYKGSKIKDINIINEKYEPYLYELFYYADTILSHGAYNTMAECLSLNNKNIIVIPKPNDVALNYIEAFEKYYNNVKIVRNVL
jgi:hypothetical protein